MTNQTTVPAGEGRDERGAVTAEAAIVIPLIAVFAVAMAWLVCVGLTAVRAQDAARETARAAARSDDSGSALSLGRRVAPDGSRISVSAQDSTVVVAVTSPVKGPGGLFGRVSGLQVHAEAVAAQEPEQ